MLYVANWKMLLSYQESLAWCTAHGKKLEELAQENHQNQIVLCPEAPAIVPLRAQLDPIIEFGAQNCSDQLNGSYTGELSAKSLQELDIKFCIVGHSERRSYYGETVEQINKKALLLLQHDITPIICISDAIEAELTPTLTALAQAHTQIPIIIAYEPTSAIGTGKPATNETILQALTTIQGLNNRFVPNIPISLLYGGSVSPKNIQNLKQIPLLDGFLIGKASTDFDQFRDIIKLK
jgi:triosephosphate isomerase